MAVTRTVIIRPYPPGLMALRAHIGRIHMSVVRDIFTDARDRAPVRTGELRLSMHIRLIRLLLSHIVVGTDHWQPQEYGAGPHEIRPIPPNQALFWPGAPHPVNVVYHPGNEAQPFMRPAIYQQRSLRGRP